ncbi:MAG: acetyl-CoA carboxylase biotin carboxyl carrier protein [Chlamydiae bacterium]|nr:acetyl-CoA carboxylase biotin carboxyl carrier protein [Chlamydiota bacterium]
MDVGNIKDLIKILEESKLKKLRLKNGNFEVFLEKEDVAGSQATYLAPQQAIVKEIKEEVVKQEEGVFVTSPMVGTYYASPAPDQPPFIKVGDKVDENTVVCIIEAMKVMNEVKAQVKGTVAEILVDNAHPVEFGTKILRIVK